MIEQLADEIEVPEDEEDYLRVAQMYYNERQSKEYVEKVRNVLKYKQLKYNEIHQAILKLSPEHILTTNYDDLLDQAIQDGAHPFSVVSQDDQFPYTKNVSLLVKIHGDLEGNDFVLKEDDFLEYSSRYPLIEAFIKSVFATKLVLFIGYSFSDPNLKMILQTVRNILGQHYQNAYLLSTDEELHDAQREYLKQKGVVAINYSDVNMDHIVSYLEGENILKKNYRIEGKKLSTEGQRLLDFLRCINVYDSSLESLNQKDIVQQQYLSLKRFDELPVLPSDFINNIYPFNLSDKNISRINKSILRSNNDELKNFYFEHSSASEDEYSNWVYEPETEEEIYIAKELKSAQINFIENREKGEFSKLTFIKVDEEKKECECFVCLFYNLKLDKLIERLDNYQVDKTSLLDNDMRAAYANYKLGNLKRSIQQYEKTALKAWQSEKVITYYVATQNIKRLRNLLYTETVIGTNDQKDKVRLVDKIDEMDIEEVFYQLPSLDDEQRKLLKTINDNTIIHQTEKTIEENLDKTVNIRELYRRRGEQHFGPEHDKIIQKELTRLFTFYAGNLLVYDEYSEFKRVCKKGVEALIANHSIDSSYEKRLDKFSALFFNIFLFYSDADELKKLTQRYKVSTLPAEQKDIEHLLVKVNNFLSSTYVTSYSSNAKDESPSLKKQLANSNHFKDSIRSIVNNVFLLLSSIEINKSSAEPLIKNLLRFLESESILYWKNIEFISSFIFNQGHLFSSEDCEKLLQIGKGKSKYFSHSSDFADAIAHIFRDHLSGETVDKDLLSHLLESFSAQLNLIEYYRNMLALWHTGDEEVRLKIKSIVEQHLDEKFDIEYFRLALFRDITNERRFIIKSLERFNQNPDKGYQEIRGGVPMHTGVTADLTNFAHTLYSKNISLEESILNEVEQVPDYVKFFLFPKLFDYNKFDPLWLLFYNPNHDDSAEIYDKLSKVQKVKKAVKESLKKEYNSELAMVYTKYML